VIKCRDCKHWVRSKECRDFAPCGILRFWGDITGAHTGVLEQRSKPLAAGNEVNTNSAFSCVHAEKFKPECPFCGTESTKTAQEVKMQYKCPNPECRCAWFEEE